MFAVALEPPITDAVIVSTAGSVPEAQPLSLYVVIATPPTLVTGLVIVALPLAMQGEVNVMERGTVADKPSISTGTRTPLVP